MRFTLFFVAIACLFAFALAAAPQKAIVVTYEDPNTPQSVVDSAMEAIRKAGGVITHEYSELSCWDHFDADWDDSTVQRFRSQGIRQSSRSSTSTWRQIHCND